MTPKRWECIQHLFHATLEREPAQRPASLTRTCADDGRSRARCRGAQITEVNDTVTRSDVPAPRVSFAEALRFWVKLGFISFGGPAGQIAIMHRELVERRRWLSEERFLHALNFCVLLPGPEAQQLAIYIGWLLHRVPGGLVAGVCFVIPSIFVLLALSYVYAAYGYTAAVAGALAGFKPVVVAIVVEALLKIGGRALKRRVHVLLAVAAFVALYFLHLPFPLIVLAAGLAGLAGTHFLPSYFDAPTATKQAPTSGATSTSDGHTTMATTDTMIDDHAPPHAHTLPSRRRAAFVVFAGVVLWALPFALLVWWRGWDSLHAREYRFFTLAACVTFGGAYAVLAYVTQAAVNNFGWLTSAQAVDGLALAETTPGPLIMVLQFVGFMAGWNHPQGMSPALSGTIGAFVTTWTTFLPCFVFVLLGAPYVEQARGNRQLNGALSGITAAVVGVIFNLALVFGAAVVWPHGFRIAPDWFALTLTLLAFLALYRFKLDVLWVVLAGGLVGLTRAWLG